MINLSNVLKFVVPIVSGAIGGVVSILQMNQLKEEVTHDVTLNVIDSIEASGYEPPKEDIEDEK